MVDLAIKKKWEVTEVLLSRARGHLLPTLGDAGKEQDPRLQQCDEYLAHNELELAMEVLADIGAEHQCRGGFWRDLERAAKIMELSERSVQFRANFHEALQNQQS